MDGIHGPIANQGQRDPLPLWPVVALLALGAIAVASALWPDLEAWLQLGTCVLAVAGLGLIGAVAVARWRALR